MNIFVELSTYMFLLSSYTALHHKKTCCISSKFLVKAGKIKKGLPLQPSFANNETD